MSRKGHRKRGTDEVCPGCGLRYDDFKTHKDFQEVKGELWVDSPDSADWHYKRRGSVLRRWARDKRIMWEEHLLHCDLIAGGVAIAARFVGELFSPEVY